MIVLASGLPLAKGSSFGRQLRLLGRELAERGCPCVLAGADSSLASPRHIAPCEVDAPRLDAAALAGLASGAGDPARAAILIGYPDQLPLLAEPGPDLFLWAQFSRPPRPGSLGRAVAVPLTARTTSFLQEAGCGAIGPTIPHAVDTRLFAPAGAAARTQARAELGVAGDAFVIGAVGANTTRKRFDLLIEAFALAAIPRSVLLVKTDRERTAGGFDLQALAAACGAAGRARVLCEPFPEAAMARLYAAMDVYAHAAEWEGFCVPVIEAMACGVPVAAAATQGPAETVPYPLVDQGEWIDEGGSRLFHVAPAALAASMARLACDAGLRARLGQAGRSEAEQRYDVRVVAGQWLDLLASRGLPG